MDSIWLVGVVFLLTYALIISEKINRTILALLGGLAMILMGILTQKQAFSAIDWNVIFLLVGMMIIANILRETGLFQWIAIKAVKIAKGSPIRILLILSTITAVSSALLDNVTVVILVAPITLLAAASLQISPIPLLIAEVLASNIGGTATLIGDPPNILIGSAANIDFLTFVLNMAPVTILIFFVYLGLCLLLFRKDLKGKKDKVIEITEMDVDTLITNRLLLRKALIVISLVIIGFLASGWMHLEPATIAMSGAVVLMLWGKSSVQDMLQEIEWSTLFFFIGLFILIEAVVQVGLIDAAANFLLGLTHGNPTGTTITILWLSGLASGLIDNIPYTATMIPLVESIGETMAVQPLWWALALGACLGGNATLVGASANLIVANLATRSGHPISFLKFLRYGLVTAFVSLLIATGYLWVRYLI